MTDFFPYQNIFASIPDKSLGLYPPGPQVSPTQSLVDQLASGNIPLQTQPTNVNQGPGNTSLLAQLGTGQISLNQTSYGQAIASTNPTVVTGPASAVTVGTPPVYAGA
jgi:hypothetical protein